MASVITRPTHTAPPSLMTRRAFLSFAGAAVVGMALYSSEFCRHDLVIERRIIRLKGLSEAFAGLRIVQISDIHFAEFTEPFLVRHAVHEINRLKPDIVLLTGDFISMAPIEKKLTEKYIPVIAELLSHIECSQRWGILGNHDWMINGDMVVEAMGAVGIPILRNANLPFERDGARFWIAGVMDALSWEWDLDKTLPAHAHKDGEPVVLMAHEPDILPAVARRNQVDLMLSGHTHGGQVRLPFLPPVLLPPLGKRFVQGHFEIGGTQLYVNRGIGTVELPFRLNCPPELTELTLQPA